MDMKLELVAVPVSDVDRAKAFYVDQLGFNADHDYEVSEEIRFVQLTPPGSACSIAIGRGISPKEPGSMGGLQMVVDDVTALREELLGQGCRGQRGPGVPVGSIRVLQRPGRQRLVTPGELARPLTRTARRRVSSAGDTGHHPCPDICLGIPGGTTRPSCPTCGC